MAAQHSGKLQCSADDTKWSLLRYHPLCISSIWDYGPSTSHYSGQQKSRYPGHKSLSHLESDHKHRNLTMTNQPCGNAEGRGEELQMEPSLEGKELVEVWAQKGGEWGLCQQRVWLQASPVQLEWCPGHSQLQPKRFMSTSTLFKWLHDDKNTFHSYDCCCYDHCCCRQYFSPDMSWRSATYVWAARHLHFLPTCQIHYWSQNPLGCCRMMMSQSQKSWLVSRLTPATCWKHDNCSAACCVNKTQTWWWMNAKIFDFINLN